MTEPEAAPGTTPHDGPMTPPPGRLASVREQTDLLVRARRATGDLLDPEAALTTFAELLVPDFADWCAIDVLEPDGMLSRIAVAHADPARRPLLEALRGRYALDPGAPGWPARIVRTGSTQLARRAVEPGLLALTQDPQHLATLHQLGVGPAICTPLLAGGEVCGVLTLVRVNSKEAYRALDAAAARSLGLHAGLALVHGRLYREVKAANRAKDEFMAMLGHELRNPIGAIMNAVSVLDRLGAPDEPSARVRAIIGRQARNLARLVDDLLDMARLTSGKITLRLRSVDLHKIAERCLANVRLGGAAERHEIRLDAEPAVVTGDPTRLEQVLGNLLDNALKYTPAGGRVTVAVRCDGAAALLSVADTGIGIAPEALAGIFDLFAQGPQPPDRGHGGLGLGLTLVRRLVELHGGTVGATSGGPGQGTTVTVRLPLRPATDAPAPAPEVAPTRVATGRRILIVEDNADAREALRQLLELEGHHVEVAENARQGVELALRSRPDVAFVDIGLPGSNGYDLAREIRAARGGPPIYLVALTGYGQPADRALAKEAGFDTHLVKPVDPEELYRVLAQEGPPSDGA